MDRRGKIDCIEGQRDISFDETILYMGGMTSDILVANMRIEIPSNTCRIGACKVTLDDGKHRVTYDLDRSTVGIFQDIMVWGTITTSRRIAFVGIGQ